MGKDLVTVTLSREDSNESWGFRLAGGKGTGQPLTISQVYSRLAGGKGTGQPLTISQVYSRLAGGKGQPLTISQVYSRLVGLIYSTPFS